MLDTQVLDFIRKQRLGVLAVEMPDGSPHAAVVNFAHQENPLEFIIQTHPGSRKAEQISTGKEIRVSLVIGLEEKSNGEDKTFQIDGVANVVPSNGMASQVYLDKYTEKIGRWTDDIFLSVEPVWWRYTAWAGPGKSPLIISNA